MFEMRWKHIRQRIARKKFEKMHTPIFLHENRDPISLIFDEIEEPSTASGFS